MNKEEELKKQREEEIRMVAIKAAVRCSNRHDTTFRIVDIAKDFERYIKSGRI